MFTPSANRVVAFFIICFGFLAGCSSQPDLVWNQEDGYRWAELSTSFFGQTGFSRHSSSETGITFRNDVREELKRENRHYLNGSGVAVADVDGDGLVDMYFAAIDGPNKLYKNLGNFQFEDITDKAGLAHEGFNSTGVVFADVNSDNSPDLLISSLSDGNSLYINDGTGQFTLKEDSGLGESRGAHTMALADVNKDGHLDLYITNYKIRTARDIFSAQELSMDNTVEMVNGELQVLPSFDEYFTIVETAEGSFRNEKGEPDQLYLNQGEGRFQRIEPLEYFFDENGDPVGLAPDWGLTATFRDVNGDQYPDLYVANDFWTPDRFWINRGDGTFQKINREAIRSMSFSSMGVDFSDINRDGHLDFVVTEMLSQNHSSRAQQSSEFLPEYEGRTLHNRNSVYLNRGDLNSNFAQIAYYSGLEATEWSWATAFLDVDLDGYEDLIVATGFTNDYQDMDTQIAMYEADMENTQDGGDILRYPRLELTNKIFRNNGDLTFSDKSNEWGFNSKDISMGMALADLDNDGDQDVIFNRLDDEASVYENRSNNSRIAVRLKGVPPNTHSIGAEVELTGGKVRQSKEITAGGNYLSGSQQQVVFAAEEDHDNYSIIVTWPDGNKSTIENVKANRIYEIDQASIEILQSEAESDSQDIVRPMFIDRSETLNHTHHENSYDDFRFSPLLPQKLSRFGPGVAWIDINRNGRDDLLITSGKDGQPALLRNEGDGDFKPEDLEPFTQFATGDQTSIVGWTENESVRFAVGSANYEQGNPNVPSAFIYSIDENMQVQQIPGVLSTTGPIAAADYTGDGSIDLFIGGRFKPGQYPVDADSRLFRNNQGRFEFDEKNSRILTGVGLVTDALFADLTGNGHQDLLISTEWGTLKLFENRGDRFVEISEETGLDRYNGWWNGIAVGDFTGNGLPDIIALNIGLNSSYQIRNEHSLRMYYDDFNWDRRLDILDSYYSEEIEGYVPRRKLHDFESVPTILSNVSSHAEFARASIEEIFGQMFNDVPFKEINTLEHMIFVNTGDGFEPKPLPKEAQFSAGFYAGVADFNNDGNEDLFISQNFFAFPEKTPRLDAGRGLLLQGDGNANFVAVPGSLSGIKVYGEQRGAAVGDFNQDGRTDLAVSQNNGQTKLFQNQGESKGIRVRLVGPPSNDNAVGSSIRLEYENGEKGPSRFIQAGGSYASQNSYLQVMGISGTNSPSTIEVTWPDGTVQKVEIVEGQDEYRISNIEQGMKK
jgi:hypothetical protein